MKDLLRSMQSIIMKQTGGIRRCGHEKKNYLID